MNEIVVKESKITYTTLNMPILEIKIISLIIITGITIFFGLFPILL